MNLINKGPTPPTFLTYSKSVGAAYSSIPSKVKEKVISSLRSEQGNLCGYCQKRLGKKVSIEHFCEQSICNGTKGLPDLRLDYSNYLLVCDGNQHNTNNLTCDKQKAFIANKKVLKAKYLPIAINPWNKSHINRIVYSKDGTISSTDEIHDSQMNEVLNLNDLSLKKERRETWISLLKASRKKNGYGLDKSKMMFIIKGRNSDTKNLPSYSGMLNYILIKYSA